MNIGIDIDGVMADYGKFLRENGKKYFDKRRIAMKNPDGYFVDEVFDCTMKQGKTFWIKHSLKYCAKEPPMKDCPEVIRRLKEAGHNICLITCRAFSGEKGPAGVFARSVLRNWLRRNKIHYDEIVFRPDERAPEKLNACREHHIDVMIDDDPKNITVLIDHIRVICFDSPWNRNLSDNRMFRAHSWLEIEELINTFSKTI